MLSLKYANSPYAFLSVGSTIVCDLNSYIQVGGMNKKKAGEDFYFLEKLAKIYPIEKINESIVFPSSRISTRVPFGTGPRIKRFLEKTQNEYLLYSAETFEILKQWLKLFYSNEHNRETEILLKKAKDICPELKNFLIENKFEQDWHNILNNSKSEKQLNMQRKYWMDGFKTLKLIHYLKDNRYPNKEMFCEINNLFDKMTIKFDFRSTQKIPPIETQIKYLNLLRKHT